jgi:uncharacterized protein YbjT (DUF2867 family)
VFQIFTTTVFGFQHVTESVLRSSGIPYTVVRPGGLTHKLAGISQLRAGAAE